MDATELQVVTSLLLFLGLGSSFIHYKSYTQAKAKQRAKQKLVS